MDVVGPEAQAAAIVSQFQALHARLQPSSWHGQQVVFCNPASGPTPQGLVADLAQEIGRLFDEDKAVYSEVKHLRQVTLRQGKHIDEVNERNECLRREVERLQGELDELRAVNVDLAGLVGVQETVTAVVSGDDELFELRQSLQKLADAWSEFAAACQP